MQTYITNRVVSDLTRVNLLTIKCLNMKSTVNQRIKMLREALKLSKTDFAALLDMHASAISRLESGENEPRGTALDKICELTKADEVWLFEGMATMFSEGDDETNRKRVLVLLAEKKKGNTQWKDEAYFVMKEENNLLKNELNRVWAIVNHITGGKIPSFKTALDIAGGKYKYLPGIRFPHSGANVAVS